MIKIVLIYSYFACRGEYTVSVLLLMIDKYIRNQNQSPATYEYVHSADNEKSHVHKLLNDARVHIETINYDQ